MCLHCSYLNTEVVGKSRQCKIDVDFYKLGIEYEGARTEIREVSVQVLWLVYCAALLFNLELPFSSLTLLFVWATGRASGL